MSGVRVASFGLAVAVAAIAVVAASAAARIVTIEAEQFREPGAPWQSASIRGTAPTAAAGEAVELLVRECGAAAFRQVPGAQVTPAGRWEAKVTLWVRSAYRARWRDQVSPTIDVVPPLRPSVEQKPRRRFVVSVWAGTLAAATFNRKVVELQRLGRAGWVRVQRARLRRGDSLRLFETTFVIRQRGLTMRVLAPEPTARPCYRAGTSTIFTS